MGHLILHRASFRSALMRGKASRESVRDTKNQMTQKKIHRICVSQHTCKACMDAAAAAKRPWSWSHRYNSLKYQLGVSRRVYFAQLSHKGFISGSFISPFIAVQWSQSTFQARNRSIGSLIVSRGCPDERFLSIRINSVSKHADRICSSFSRRSHWRSKTAVKMKI